MNPLERLFGFAPTPDETGRGSIPSRLGRLLGVAKRSGYQPIDFAGLTHQGDELAGAKPRAATSDDDARGGAR